MYLEVSSISRKFYYVKLCTFYITCISSYLLRVTERELAEQREHEKELELKRLKEQKERMRAASTSPPQEDVNQQQQIQQQQTEQQQQKVS